MEPSKIQHQAGRLRMPSVQELTWALQALHNIEVWGGSKAQRDAGALHPWQSRDGRLQRLLPIGTWRLPIAARRRPVAAQRLPGRRDSWRRHTVGVERGCSRHAWLLEALWTIATLAHMTSLNSIASSLRAGGENVTCGREAEASLSVHEFDQHWASDFNQEPNICACRLVASSTAWHCFTVIATALLHCLTCGGPPVPGLGPGTYTPPRGRRLPPMICLSSAAASSTQRLCSASS